MKYLAISIGVLGAAQTTLWAWAPMLARWQTENILKKYQATDSVEVAMEVFQESMQFAYVESAITGVLMLAAAFLLLKRHHAGWNLWLTCLGLVIFAATFKLVAAGPSAGLIARYLLIIGFSYATFKSQACEQHGTILKIKSLEQSVENFHQFDPTQTSPSE